jgi:hypothetical protein
MNRYDICSAKICNAAADNHYKGTGTKIDMMQDIRKGYSRLRFEICPDLKRWCRKSPVIGLAVLYHAGVALTRISNAAGHGNFKTSRWNNRAK